MSIIRNEKIFSKQWFIAYTYIILGSLLFAIGDVMFVAPYKLAPGGVYGLANVFYSLWGWKISYWVTCMEIPLLIIGTWILGPKFGIKTLVSTFAILFFTWIIETTWGVRPLIHDGLIANPAVGELGFVPDYFLNTLVSGLIYGVSIGLIFKSGATSGGSDIISMILNKYTKISLGTLVLIVDSIISLSTLIAFGQLRLPIYSIILIAIESKIIDMFIDGIKSYKTIFIITNKQDEIRDAICNDLNRGGTCFKGTGLYQGAERNMIYTTVSRSEFVRLKEGIHQIDPEAFINVIDSSEIMGKGFKALPNARVN
jgi:uncharacterized membrane-anchored protein YitT (DUF2179 family)